MPRIALTDFVDFVTSAGTRKLAKVRTVKNRPKYLPAFDYWRNLRFKSEPLSRNRVAVVLDMMNAALAGKGEDMRVAVLDVPAGKLITAPGPASPQINALLESEAASFLQLWEAV